MATDFRSRPWLAARTLAFLGVVALSLVVTGTLVAALLVTVWHTKPENETYFHFRTYALILFIVGSWFMHVSAVAARVIDVTRNGNKFMRCVAPAFHALSVAFIFVSVILLAIGIAWEELEGAHPRDAQSQVQEIVSWFCVGAAATCGAFGAVSPWCLGKRAAQPRRSNSGANSDSDVNSDYGAFVSDAGSDSDSGAFASDEERPDRLAEKKKMVV